MTLPEGFDFRQASVISAWEYDRPLIACRIDPTGRYVVTGSEDAVAERFLLAGGTRTLMTGGHQTWIMAVTFTKDGVYTITGGCEGKLTWWETAAEAPTPIRSISAHQGWIRCLATSPDGNTIVSGGNDGFLRFWNPVDGTLIREVNAHPDHIYSVTFHPVENLLLSGDLKGVIKQWDVATGNEIRTFDGSELSSYNAGQGIFYGGIRALAVSPDGKWLAAGGLFKATNPLAGVNEPLVLLFDWATQKIERKHVAENLAQGAIERLVWLADGTLMGVSGGATGGFLVFWNPNEEKDIHKIKLPHTARDMDLAPDGLRVATAHYDRHLRITRLAAPPPEPST
ncbi:WD40 repeat domain-containing protein [Planctomicrobium sp. SH661]|uniref:WD40 repeat domain-containing protein n=1 Tax=Planctomicrobium sp. SH661 TaxID=3448124 RepID=UPI003F5B7D57